MDSHHPEPKVGNSDAQEASNSIHQNEQHFQEESSEVRRRTPALVQDATNPSSSADSPPLSASTNENLDQKKPQQKGLNSFSSKCYKAWMLLNIVFSVYSIFIMFAAQTPIHEIDRLTCLILVWAVIQYIFAFLGARKGDLEKIEKAFMLMKMWIGLVVISFADNLLQDYKLQKSNRSISLLFNPGDFSPLMDIVMFVIFTILPTRRVRNRLKPSAQKKDSDLIQKLDTWKYIAFKNWTLIAFCWLIKSIVSDLWEVGVDDLKNTMSKMSSSGPFLIWIVTNTSLNVLFLAILSMIFQGIRERNLQQIQRAINLMKISFVIGIINIGSYYYLTEEDIPAGQKVFAHLRSKIGDLMSFFAVAFLYFVLLYFCFMRGACKVRDILKASQKKKED